MEAQKYYDMFLLLTEVHGISLSDIAGEIYKEDLAYLIAQQRFKIEAQNKWSNTDQNIRVRR
ncbi:MAG: hypothetical protein ACREA4_01955 [Nitrososphaera sp.]